MKKSKNNDISGSLEDISEIIFSTLKDHLDYIGKLNETNPRLASILLMDFAFHLKMLKNLSKLKKED